MRRLEVCDLANIPLRFNYLGPFPVAPGLEESLERTLTLIGVLQARIDAWIDHGSSINSRAQMSEQRTRVQAARMLIGDLRRLRRSELENAIRYHQPLPRQHDTG